MNNNQTKPSNKVRCYGCVYFYITYKKNALMDVKNLVLYLKLFLLVKYLIQLVQNVHTEVIRIYED